MSKWRNPQPTNGEGLNNVGAIIALRTVMYQVNVWRLWSLINFSSCLESCYWREEAQKQLEEKLNVCLNKELAKNVIVFLADGMSAATVTAARIFLGQSEGNSGESSSLRFEEYPYLGLSKTYCVDKQVGEPARTSTAFLSGVKANYGTVGVTAEVPRGNCVLSQEPKNQVDTLLTWAQEAGKSTGIITGDRVT
ncbi:hypothetical protein J6590_106329, partial [Homalodisca vitripennis]